MSNTATRKILIEAIYQTDFEKPADFSSAYANTLPPPQPPLRLPGRPLFPQAPLV